MRFGKVFAAAFGGVEGLTFVALGIVAHRLDLWLEWQVALAVAALVAGIAALILTLVREQPDVGPSTTRLHRYLQDVPGVGGGALAARIGGSGPRTVVPHRRDGPIEDTKSA